MTRTTQAAALLALLSVSSVGYAQNTKSILEGLAPQPIEEIPVIIGVDSGLVQAKQSAGKNAEIVFSTEVNLPFAPWIRLQFQEAALSGNPAFGNDAFLWITSLADGAVQVMTADDLKKWGNTSAYFNGDRVRVDLYAYPNAGKNRLMIDTVLMGPPGNPTPFSICGTDDRVLSTDARMARVVPIGCTAFMIDDQTHNFLTAGHCAGGGLSVLQFNVPLSSSGGAIVNPPPQDQYPVDPTSVQAQSGGIGNDWAYFGVFANSNTGLTPFQAQGAFYFLANAAPPVLNQTIRITGYGVDSTPATSNQVQQTNSGPYTFRSGNVIKYAVDTTGGNSGSPVLDLTTGLCIGIHTNAGCTTGGGANQGTAIQHASLQAAMNNPLGVTAAPDCNNNGVPDDVDILQGATDCNNNGIIDSCEVIGIPGDLNGDNIVDGGDLATLLGLWGTANATADVNNDGIVDSADLAILLGNWGPLC